MLLVLAIVLAAWLMVGLLRTEAVARDWFAHAHGTGATVVNVQAQVGPAVPPFWSVNIGGGVVEAGRTSPVYASHMILWVEPITGVVIVAGSG